MPSNTYEFFKYVIIIQIFFGISISLITYAIPNKNYVTFVTPSGIQSVSDISSKLESSVHQSTKLPLIDLAAMVFYTGNIILDLLLNSIFAIPAMATILVSVFTVFIPMDPVIKTYLSIFVFSIISVIYIIGILGIIVNIRSRGGLNVS